MIVRRIEDTRFEVESGGVKPMVAFGRVGTSIWVDPAVCCHYGGRCKRPRAAIFVSFYSDRPFVAPVSLIARSVKKIIEIGKELRPDLDPSIFDRMLHV